MPRLTGSAFLCCWLVSGIVLIVTLSGQFLLMSSSHRFLERPKTLSESKISQRKQHSMDTPHIYTAVNESLRPMNVNMNRWSDDAHDSAMAMCVSSKVGSRQSIDAGIVSAVLLVVVTASGRGGGR